MIRRMLVSANIPSMLKTIISAKHALRSISIVRNVMIKANASSAMKEWLMQIPMVNA